MGGSSNIEWTERTWNPVVGCTKISPGCAHCYAEVMANRLKAMALKDIADGKDPGRKRHYIDAIDDKGRWTGKLIPVPEAVSDPFGWKKPQMIFVNSMSDLFHEDVSFEFIDQVFATIYNAQWHTYQVLTKRPERMLEYLQSDPVTRIAAWAFSQWTRLCPERAATGLLQNVDLANDIADQWPFRQLWLGTSCETQKEFDARVPLLEQCPAGVRFVSLEPLLGPIKLPNQCQLDWVIVGGESGHGARLCRVNWIWSIIERCLSIGIPCFVKQIGSNPQFDGSMCRDCADADGTCPTRGFACELKDKKGGDPAEWPAAFRVRQMPTPRSEAV